MGFRYRKSVKLAPRVRLNFSKHGMSASIGGGGLTYNTRGKITIGIPGSGVSYEVNLKKKKQDNQQRSQSSLNQAPLWGFLGFIGLSTFAGCVAQMSSNPPRSEAKQPNPDDQRPAFVQTSPKDLVRLSLPVPQRD